MNNAWPTSRFYRAVDAAKIADGRYAASSPILAPDDTIYAFANVAYRYGTYLSTRLIKVAARDLPAVRPTLHRTALIDPMDDDRAWFWWLVGTDPLNQTALLQPWTGPRGALGFTHAQPGAFSLATAALGDPQFKWGDTTALFVDVWAYALPPSLEVTVASKFFQPCQINYKTSPKPGESKDGWVTRLLPPSDVLDDKSAQPASGKDVDFLCLSGAANGLKHTVFKNLRWEKLD